MQVIDVPRYNEDGSVSTMVSIPPEQAKQLLTFALNVFMAAGASNVVFAVPKKDSNTLQ